MKELMRDRLKVYPFQSDGADRLFLARFEFPKFGEDFQIPKGDWRSLKLLPGEEAPPATEDDKPIGFIHYLAGFPIDCVEMLMLIGEYSSDENSITVVPGKGRPTAPVPNFFIWPDEEKLLLNTTALVEQYSLFLAENLPGEPEPTKAHWWFRVELV